jgi:hypothetical protein
MNFPLPGVIIPVTDISPKTLILYGPPKIGKTQIYAALPSYILLDIEHGSSYFQGTKAILENILQITAFEEFVKKNNKPYKFIVVDTLDELEVWCEQEATRRYKATIIGKNFSGFSVLELAQGGGYLHLRNIWYEYFNRLRQLAQYVIFIGHVKDKMLTINSKETAAADLDLTGKVKNITCSYADAIAHAFRDKDGSLKLTFITKDTANCGSRCQHLAGKEFTFNNPATIKDWRQIYVDI